MTTEVFTPVDPYTVSGVGPYAFADPYFSTAELYVIVVLNGVRSLLTLTADYTVSPDAAPPGTTPTGGNVTLTAVAAAAYDGGTLSIFRATDIEQGWAGTTGSREKGLETALDRLALAIQDANEVLSRAVRVDKPIDPAVKIADGVLNFDGSGALTVTPLNDLFELRTIYQNASGPNAFVDCPDLPTLDSNPDWIAGMRVMVRIGSSGKSEYFLIVAAGTYAIVDGVFVRDLAGSGLQAVSMRTEYLSYSEAKNDRRSLTSGRWSMPAYGGAGQYVTAGDNWGETTAGGSKLLVEQGDVRVWGAPADGVNDDTSAFARCSTGMQGKSVKVPPLKYVISSLPTDLNNVDWQGSPFAHFLNKKMPLATGLITGNTQTAIVAAVIRRYDATGALGSGYVNGETVNIAAPGGSGGTATVTTSGGNGGVATVTLVSGGAGYTNGAQAQLESATGKGCLVTLTVSGGAITAVVKHAGYYFLKDGQEDHDPILMGPVTASGSGSVIMDVNLDLFGIDTTLWTPAGFVAGADETLSLAQGCEFGASVGVTSVTLEGSYTGEIPTAEVYWDSASSSWKGVNAPYTFTWTVGASTATLLCTRTPSAIRNVLGPVPAPWVQLYGTTPFIPRVYSLHSGDFTIEFKDPATGNDILDPTGIGFFLFDQAIRPRQFNFGTDPGPGTNIWMVGVFTRKAGNYPA